MAQKKDPKKAYSYNEAKNRCLPTYIGKDGNVKATVSADELRKAGYTTGPKGLRAYLNAKGKPAKKEEKPKGGRGKPATAKPKGGVKGGRGSPATAKPEDSYFVQVITGQRLKKNLKKAGKALKGRKFQ